MNIIDIGNGAMVIGNGSESGAERVTGKGLAIKLCACCSGALGASRHAAQGFYFPANP
jgi:hypothetical protein